ncbi:MAG TPA: lipid II flippase MurJ [Azospirillum sp.]|nr:lipid II flippase MurJ [Azospirillum sp.]
MQHQTERPDSDRATGTGNPSGSSTLVADSRTVAGWNLVSRITGFGRVAIMGAVFGPTYFGNIFQTSALLPSMIFALLGGSLVGAILVPPLVHWLDARDEAAFRRLANGFLGTTMLVLAVVAGLCLLLSPLLLTFATAAVDDPAVRTRQREIGVVLLAMLLPQILLYGVAAVGMAVQHAHGRFAVAAAAQVLENVSGIAVLLIAALVFGTGTALEQVTLPHLLLLGCGTTAAVGMNAILQWWGARMAGHSLVPRAGWRDVEIRRLMWIAFTSSGYTALYNLVTFAALVVAGRIPGGVIAAQIGLNFSFLPIALSAVPLASAQLPRLSRSFNAGDTAAFAATFRESIALTRFITLPAAFLLLAMSDPLAQAVAFGDLAGPAGVAMIAACIAGLGPGVVGEALISVSTSASYARRNGLAPLRAMALRAVVALLGMAIALGTMEGIGILFALGLSFSAGNLAAAAYIFRSVMPAMPAASGGHCRRPLGERVVGELMVSAVPIALGAALAFWWQNEAGSHAQKIGVAVATIAVSGALYLGMQWMRRSHELTLFSEIIGIRLPGRMGGGPRCQSAGE